MSDARWYAVWPYKRSRSRLRALGTWHFQKLYPLPYTARAGNWPLILKLELGHNIQFDLAGSLIFFLVFLSRDFQLGRNVSCEESTLKIYFFLVSRFSHSTTSGLILTRIVALTPPMKKFQRLNIWLISVKGHCHGNQFCRAKLVNFG